MVEASVSLKNVEGTEAALGWAGGHTIVVDRPDGKAGGMGLGFNGAQMLAFAIGGCFCNDLRYEAHKIGTALKTISVDVTVQMEGDPLITTSATMSVTCSTQDGSDPTPVIERAKAGCMVKNSLERGIPVSVEQT